MNAAGSNEREQMRGKYVAGLATALALGTPAVADAGPPAPVDPQNWTFQDNFAWNDYHPLPGKDYSDPAIVPTVKKLTYHVHLKRVILRRLVLGIADGVVHADGNPAYEVSDLRVGLFKDATAPVPAAAPT